MKVRAICTILFPAAYLEVMIEEPGFGVYENITR
jgi:hypothetical protein